MKEKIKSILFICLGNICRSTLAEGIAKEKAKELGLNIRIDSAGTGNWHVGEPPCNDSIKMGKIKGIDISSQRARQVTSTDFKEFDLIVAMDDKNLLDLQIRGLKGAKKFGEFGLNEEDIPDPYFYSDFDGFYMVYDMLEIGIENIFKDVLSEA